MRRDYAALRSRISKERLLNASGGKNSTEPKPHKQCFSRRCLFRAFPGTGTEWLGQTFPEISWEFCLCTFLGFFARKKGNTYVNNLTPTHFLESPRSCFQFYYPFFPKPRINSLQNFFQSLKFLLEIVRESKDFSGAHSYIFQK